MEYSSNVKSKETITNKLIRKLRALFDDDEFVSGILIYASHVEDRKTILEFIEHGEDVSVETVTVLALDLDDARSELQFCQ